ncbi:MAG: ribulose-phosphate 3-epimerase [Deltaproteobacteria bacterium]|nr:ribulose-phosphate 3-epimerase [Deltaproteobacteria bacterium]
MPLIAPSILSADFGRLGDEVKAVAAAGADWIHIDVMDGHFVDNLTIGPVVVAGIRDLTTLPLDVHLMIEEPEKYAPRFLEALHRSDGKHAERYVSVHWEVVGSVAGAERAFRIIEQHGARPGIVINPGTAVDGVLPLVERAALILVMSVEPGWGGQPFDESSLPKLRALAEARARCGSSCLLEIDGGISAETAPQRPVSTATAAAQAGADVLVAGSAVFRSKNYTATIAALRGGPE